MRTRAVIALLLTWTAAVAAQDPAVFRTTTDVVLVPVAVTDRNGRFVHGLTSDQFAISDGGTRRAVKQFSAEHVPVSIAVLLDISGSMAQNADATAADDARWADTRQALELLLTRLSPADEVLFAVFNDQVAASPWTGDHESVLATFDRVRPGGPTGLLDAVKQIASVFRTARHQRKVLLLISDGNDTQQPSLRVPSSAPYDIGSIEHQLDDSRRALRQIIIEGSRNAVRRSDAVIYAVGIGTRKGVPVDTAVLDGLTRESGGYAETLRSPSQIGAAVARICDDLQAQYLLTFEPAFADGKYHPITVRTRNQRLKVRSRSGYTAGAPDKQPGIR
jgi:Ca-activated chloride channel family protein